MTLMNHAVDLAGKLSFGFFVFLGGRIGWELGGRLVDLIERMVRNMGNYNGVQ